jgi:uncharacterized protein (DUF885 family)
MAFTSIRALAFCTVAVLALPVAAEASASDDYNAIVKAYFDTQWQTHPTSATGTGVHIYDDKLDDVSAAAVTKEIAWLKQTEAKLRAVDGKTISQMDRDDRDVLLGEMDRTLLEDQTIQLWRHDPSTYVNLLTNAAFQLIERDFAPLPERMKNTIARENLMPAMLVEGKKNLTNMPPVYVEVALQNLDGGISVLANDVPSAFKSVKDPALQKAFAASTSAAVNAAKDFKTWLIAQKPNAHGSFMIGRDGLQKMLASDLVDVPVETVLAAGEADFAKNHAAFLATEKLVDPKNPSQAMTEIEKDHPSDTAQLLDAARGDLNSLQSFIEQHHIVTLPSQMLPVVAETPPFARATIFGETDPPGALETHATKVYYFITPPDPKSPAAQQAQILAYWNRPMLQNLTVHESLPGHFTQYLYLHAHPEWSLVRKTAGSYTTTEGWAHYSEQMMLDDGLSKGDPRYRLTQLQDALLRDCRLIASIKMHTGAMTLDQATNMMQAQCFQPAAVALGEARRGTDDPGYYSYTLGKLEILKLRADAQKKEGANFSLTKFHDAFMNSGLVPVSIIRREMGVEGSSL